MAKAGSASLIPPTTGTASFGVDGVEAQVRCTGAALEVSVPAARRARRADDGVCGVREAFQISKALRALIG